MTAQTDVYSFAITIYEVITGGNVAFYPVKTPIVPCEEVGPLSDTVHCTTYVTKRRGEGKVKEKREHERAIESVPSLTKTDCSVLFVLVCGRNFKIVVRVG